MKYSIKEQTQKVIYEVLEKANLQKGDIFVVGCSSSKILGDNPGTNSSPEVAHEVLNGIYPILQKRGIYIAAQCCEHLNRAIVLEQAAAREYSLEKVNAVPKPKAGGSFAAAVYNILSKPVLTETVKAHAGIDIGGVLIGMHLKPIAVPLAMENNTIGGAAVIAARTRPKFIGGERAYYDENLL